MDSADVASVAIALLALAVSVYKEFLQGHRLHSSIDQLSLTRMPTGNRIGLLFETLLDDLLSPAPSPSASAVLTAFPQAHSIVAQRDRVRLIAHFQEALQRGSTIAYDPPDELVERHLPRPHFGISFYIPMIVHNSGRKFAHVSSLVLVIRPGSPSRRRRALRALVEVEPASIIPRGQQQTDADRIKASFTGFSIGPGETIRVDPLFGFVDSEHHAEWKQSLEPGKYRLRIIGYGRGTDRVLVTDEADLNLTLDLLLQSARGNDAMLFLGDERIVPDATHTLPSGVGLESKS